MTPLTGHVTTAATNRFVCTTHAVENRDGERELDTVEEGEADADEEREALADSDAKAPPRDALTDVDARRDTDGDTDGETILHCA